MNTRQSAAFQQLALAFSFAAFGISPAFPAVPGAIFTTNSTGAVVNQNLYNSKCDVYLDGGPGPKAPAKAAGLPAGDYYFQVTDPSGATLLSTDPVSNRRFTVSSNGVIVAFTGTGGPAHPTGIDQDHGSLGAITIRLANSNCPTDFANTPNTGDVYKVWATPVGSFLGDPTLADNPCSGACSHGFVHSQSKTDNFKAVSAPSATFSLTLIKQFITDVANPMPFADTLGWGMSVTDPSNVTNHYTTDSTGQYTVPQLTVGALYTVTEDTYNKLTMLPPLPAGPIPAGCTSITDAPVALVFLSVDGGPEVLQPVNASLQFTASSTLPVTIRFVNNLSCPRQ
jgi:hypothetical protein